MINNKTIRQSIILNVSLPCEPGEEITKTASGAGATNPCEFTCNLTKPLQSLVFTFTPEQEGTGDPSPDNPRPIYGEDGIKFIHRCGEETNVYEKSFGNTLYGGYYDALSGEVWATLKNGLLQSNAPNFTESITTNFTTYYARISGIFTDMSTSGYIEVYCDKFKGTKTPAQNNYVCYIQNGYLNCRVSNGDFDNAAAFKTWVQTNGLQLVYELATPVKIATIDPIVINTFKGLNHMHTRGGIPFELSYLYMERGACNNILKWLPLFYSFRKES